MKIRKRMLTGGAMALLALLAGVWTVAETARPASAQADLAELRQQLYDAINAGDLDAAMDFLTEDSVLEGPPGCRPTPCVGKEAIRALFESFVADNIQFTSISVEVSGNTVTGRIEIRTDGLLALGIDRLVATDTGEWTDGKNSSTVVEFDLTDQPTADFVASLEDQAEPEAMPATGSGGLLADDGSSYPAWWYALAASGSLVTIVGLARLRRTRSRR